MICDIDKTNTQRSYSGALHAIRSAGVCIFASTYIVQQIAQSNYQLVQHTHTYTHTNTGAINANKYVHSPYIHMQGHTCAWAKQGGRLRTQTVCFEGSSCLSGDLGGGICGLRKQLLFLMYVVFRVRSAIAFAHRYCFRFAHQSTSVPSQRNNYNYSFKWLNADKHVRLGSALCVVGVTTLQWRAAQQTLICTHRFSHIYLRYRQNHRRTVAIRLACRCV